MTTTDVAVIVGGLFLGFWAVNSAMASKSAKKPAPEQAEETHSAQGQAQQNTRQAPQGEAWFRILGMPESAGKEEIASAYKTKIRQYHPDKVASLGPELRELAELKSKQINAAYDYALKLRG